MIKPFSGTFPLTQAFGLNPQIYKRFGMAGHNGTDVGLPDNTPLLASISGKVLETGNSPTGYGLYIKIENDKEGVLTAHMKSFKVTVGQDVTEGQLIGYSNNTGFSTGSHLHFAYFLKPRDRNNGYDGWIDPMPHFTSSTPTPTDDRRGYWFDLMNKVIWNLPKEKITDAMVNEFVAQYPSRAKRAGASDLIRDLVDSKLDITKMTAQQFIDAVVEKYQPSVAKIAQARENGRIDGLKQAVETVKKLF